MTMNNFIETQRFLDALRAKEIVFYCPGSLAVYAYEWLKQHGLGSNVSCCIVQNPAKSPSSRLGLQVNGPEALKGPADQSVIIASGNCVQAARILRGGGFRGAVYHYVNFYNKYFTATYSAIELEMARSLYNAADGVTSYIFDLIESSTREGLSPFMSTQPDDLAHYPDYWEKVEPLSAPKLTIVDCGAYTGDSLTSLLDIYGGRIARYYALEPDKDNYDQLMATVRRLPADNRITCYNIGLSDENGTFRFEAGGSGARLSPNGASLVSCRRLDDLPLEIIGRLCLKMDIEGAEMPALLGAAEMIRTHRPELAICLYHRKNDLWEVPRLLKELVPEYDCVVRCGMHTECYASVDLR